VGRQWQAEFGLVVLLLALAPQANASLAHATGAHAQHPAAPHAPGYLGIGFHDAAGRGVEIIVVDHDGPAGKAGLRLHDVIMKLNGQPVATADMLSRMIHEAAPGTVIILSYQRDGKTMSGSVRLADRAEVERSSRDKVATADAQPGESDPPVAEFVPDPPPPTAATSNKGFFSRVLSSAPFTGLGLQTMEPQLAEFFGDTEGFGMLVQTVAPNSPAALAGLHAGDVLLRADTVALRNASDWGKRLRSNPGQPIVLNIIRDKHEMTVTLTPELRHHSLLEWPQIQMYQTLH
jgi:S1-C subfamily serine protease